MTAPTSSRFGLVEAAYLLFAAIFAVAAWRALAAGLPELAVGCGVMALACLVGAAAPWRPRRARYLRS